MANPFDQFDEVSANPFDQFDVADEPKADAQPVTTQTQRRRLRAESIDRGETDATRDLPELSTGGLLAGEDQAKVAAIAPVLLTTPEPQEIAQILSATFPSVGIQYDEKGNIIAGNNKTGAKVVINKPGLTPIDLMQMIGVGAAYTPAGRAATVPAAIGRAALTETGIQGAQKLAGGEFDAEDVALSGAVGGLGKAVENITSAGVRSVRGQIPEEQAALIAEAEKRGIPLMTTDVIPNETVAGNLAQRVGEAIPFAGTGQVRKAQQAAREEAITDIVQAARPRFDDVVQSLRTQTDKVRRAAGNRLGLIADRMQGVGDIPVSNSVKAIDDVVADMTGRGKVPERELVEKLLEHRTALLEGQDFKTLDTLRSNFREKLKDGQGTLITRADASINKIYDAMTRDLKRSVEANLGKRSAEGWSAAKGVYFREMNMLKKSRLKSVLDKGDVTPESVENIIFSQKPSEVRNLFKSLTPEGKDAMRGTILNRAVVKATNAEGVITPTALATQLGKLRKQTDIAFQGVKRKELEGLVNVLNATRRAQDAKVVTPTGQTVTGFGAGYLAFNDLLGTAGAGLTAAGLARTFESKPVRNALLRAGSLKKGTDAYDKAISEAIRLVTTTAQALKSENVREDISQELEQ